MLDVLLARNPQLPDIKERTLKDSRMGLGFRVD